MAAFIKIIGLIVIVGMLPKDMALLAGPMILAAGAAIVLSIFK